MLRIVRVGGLDDDKVDIEFSNGSVVLLDLQSKMREPGFAALWEDNLIGYPKTDGDRVFWANGASLTLREIMEILQESPVGPQ